MRLFFDQLHVQMLPDGRVALSVRVNDNRVDEYHLDASVVWAVLEAAAEMPDMWSGPDELRSRLPQGGTSGRCIGWDSPPSK
jgi:hypothetical protein